MTRADAIAGARQLLQSGEFLAELDRRVAYRTESQKPGSGDAHRELERRLQRPIGACRRGRRALLADHRARVGGHARQASQPTDRAGSNACS